jgi:hypothetical protein
MKQEKIELPRGVLKVKKGFNPNSSSIGTVVYSFPLALCALSGILALLAALVHRRKDGDR